MAPSPPTGSPRGRPRGFDADVVLDRAVDAFWATGFAATSVSDLERATGLRRASLYGAFGDKQQLYLAALERYRRREGDRLYAGLPDDLPVLPAVRGLLEGLRDDIVADADRRGCFVVNATCERVPGDGATMRQVSAQYDLITRRLAALLHRGVRSGELPADTDVDAVARLLTTLIQGMRVVGRAAPDAAALDDVIRQALRLVSDA